MEKQKISQWKLMFLFLKDRILKPWSNPSYAMYFIVIIIFVGSFGILRDLLNAEWCWSSEFDGVEIDKFAFNLTGISLSLTTASVIDLVFITRKTIEAETSSEKYNQFQIESIKKSIRIFGLISLIVIFINWILVNSFLESYKAKIILSILSLLISYAIWWISNVRNKILNKYKTNIGAQIGGDLPKSLQPNPNQTNEVEKQTSEEGLVGTTQNFKTE